MKTFLTLITPGSGARDPIWEIGLKGWINMKSKYAEERKRGNGGMWYLGGVVVGAIRRILVGIVFVGAEDVVGSKIEALGAATGRCRRHGCWSLSLSLCLRIMQRESRVG